MPWSRLPSRLLLALSCALAPLAAVSAAPVAYRYDTTHSQILFSIDHNGFSRPFGRLHIAKGWLRFDQDDWSQSATELDIDLASLDMGDAAWSAAVLKPAYLDVEKARYAHFTSTSVERKDDTHGIVHGNLTLRGVTRAVDIPFTFNRLGTTIYGMHTVAGFSGTLMLQRDDYGITATPNAVGHGVSVWLELEAIQEDTTRNNKESP
ncbi:YceI family protein [Dyella japonica]|uniref:Polyisoprenoid-binding protein n=1 Tax=Dyella japonica A8 TaxID=1217721 RepID=A0A075K517_9GAMM|nr:YceI family protein [Dyella japonica]AIF49316.1 polyisoprenoid-binding protein [Dyella japonica A8]